MATAPFVFNIAKGSVAHYSRLPVTATTDALILVLLQSTGLEADGTLQDYDTLSAILAGTNDECTFTGYTRRTLASITQTVDDTNNRMDVDAADPATYTNTGAAQISGAAIICYDPDTGAGTDADLIPLVQLMTGTLSFDTDVVTTVAFNAAGFFRAS